MRTPVPKLREVSRRTPTISGLVYRFRKQAVNLNGSISDLVINDDPTNVMEEDWDNLVILDACRYDTFTDENWIEGNLSRRTSMGSSTGEFLQRTFKEQIHYDTVYITANPHLQIVPDTFHAVVDLVHDDDHWDQDLQTVPPEEVTEATKRVSRNYPNKKYIIHYIQPHYPFLGPTGRGLNTSSGIIGHIDKSPDVESVDGDWETLARFNPDNFWDRLAYEDAQVHERAREAYRENLRLVLEEVESLVEEVPGKTIVTSDHGNMMGERLFPIPVRGYGHPSRIHVPSLVEVPWLEIDDETRRETKAEEPETGSEPDPAVVKDRLSSLGYL